MAALVRMAAERRHKLHPCGLAPADGRGLAVSSAVAVEVAVAAVVVAAAEAVAVALLQETHKEVRAAMAERVEVEEPVVPEVTAETVEHGVQGVGLSNCERTEKSPSPASCVPTAATGFRVYTPISLRALGMGQLSEQSGTLAFPAEVAA